MASLGIGVLALPSSAAACDTAHVCHAESVWNMTNPGEEVIGVYTHQWVNTMRVPGNEPGAYVANDIWIGFPHNEWIMAGWIDRQGHHGESCLFMETSRGPGHSPVAEICELPNSSPGQKSYYLDQFEGPGTWCLFGTEYPLNYVALFCAPGSWPTTTKFVATGGQVAARTENGAVLNGADVPWTQYMQGGWYEGFGNTPNLVPPYKQVSPSMCYQFPFEVQGGIAFATGC
jgi:hypothetical protein